MKIIVATDSFKGCLSSQNIGLIIQHALHDEIPNAQVDVIPMSDGGEGFVDSIVFATQGKKVPVQVKGPFGDSIVAYYGILGDGKTIAIEVAQIVGLYQISRDQLAPLDATSFGIGEVMLHALDRGYRKFIFGLGGSATNDGGIGMLQALGGMFLDEHGKQVEPTAKGVSKVAELMLEGLDPRIGQSELVIACDVVNSLCGMNGATAVFGPQKGVREEEIEALDQSLEKFALLIEQKKNATFKDLPGAGAAGGLGFALLSMQASMRSGAEIVSELVGLPDKCKTADWVITGEGCSDEQTFFGKVPMFVAETAKQFCAHPILVSGSFNSRLKEFSNYFTSCHSISDGPLTLKASIGDAEHLLDQCVRNLAKLIKASNERRKGQSKTSFIAAGKTDGGSTGLGE